MAENTPTKGAASAPSVDPLFPPDPGGPPELAPPPGMNTEAGAPVLIIGYVQHNLRDETRVVGEQMAATFVDLTGDDQGYFKLIQQRWESGHGFLLVEEDVVPSIELLDEMWSCDREWCSAFFWAWDGALFPGESRPQRPRRYKVASTLALNKFGSSLLRRAPRAMEDAVARTNDRQHYNQLDLVLVNPGGVLHGPPYNAVPHLHGPVDHRTPPQWVATMTEADWASVGA